MILAETNLILGNSAEKLSEMDAGIFDLTVTSPPYDNLRTYNDKIETWGEHVWRAVIEQIYRVTKDGGVVVWVVNDATVNGSESGTSFRQALFAMECGFNLHDTMIYEKSGMPFPGTNRYCPCFEYMFIWSKGKPKTVNLIEDRVNSCSGRSAVNGTSVRQRDGSIKQNAAYRNDPDRRIKDIGVRTNIWRIIDQRNTNRGYTGDHPAIFPEALARDHILSWSNEGDRVLDPFMGSGTTAYYSRLLNRHFTGIEIDEGYFEIAEKRMAECMPLFS